MGLGFYSYGPDYGKGLGSWLSERGTATVHCDERGIQCRAASVYGEHDVHAVAAPGVITR